MPDPIAVPLAIVVPFEHRQTKVTEQLYRAGFADGAAHKRFQEQPVWNVYEMSAYTGGYMHGEGMRLAAERGDPAQLSLVEQLPEVPS